MVDYFGELWQSCKDLFKNPVLFVPFLLAAVAILALFVLFGGILVLALGATVGFEALDSLTPAMIAPVTIIGVLFLIVVFIVGSWFRAGQLGMIDATARGQKPTKEAFFATAKRSWSSILWFGILQSLLLLLGALPMGVFIFAAWANEEMRILWIILAVVLGLLFFLYALFLGVALFFAQPLIIDGMRAWDALKSSVNLLKTRPGFVFASWGITILFGIAVGFVLGMILLPLQILSEFVSPILSFSMSAIRAVIQMLLSIIILLFIFRMFRSIQPANAVKK